MLCYLSKAILIRDDNIVRVYSEMVDGLALMQGYLNVRDLSQGYFGSEIELNRYFIFRKACL